MFMDAYVQMLEKRGEHDTAEVMKDAESDPEFCPLTYPDEFELRPD